MSADEISERVNIEHKNAKDDKFNFIVDNAIAYADNVVKRLVALTISGDMSMFHECCPTVGTIVIKKGEDTYTMCLDIVEKDYMLDLGVFRGDEVIKTHMLFLINAVRIIYVPIRDAIRETLPDGSPPFDYELGIGHNTTIYLKEDTDMRIGIKLQKERKNENT